MIKFFIALTLLFAAPSLSYAKGPKCKKGDKACEQKHAKKGKKPDKKWAGKKDKKADKKPWKKDRKAEKRNKPVGANKPPKPAKPAAPDTEPMPLPNNMNEGSAAASPAAPAQNDIGDDIFPSTDSSDTPPPPPADDFLDE